MFAANLQKISIFAFPTARPRVCPCSLMDRISDSGSDDRRSIRLGGTKREFPGISGNSFFVALCNCLVSWKIRLNVRHKLKKSLAVPDLIANLQPEFVFGRYEVRHPYAAAPAAGSGSAGPGVFRVRIVRPCATMGKKLFDNYRPVPSGIGLFFGKQLVEQIYKSVFVWTDLIW